MSLTDQELKSSYNIERRQDDIIKISFLKSIYSSDDDYKLAKLIEADILSFADLYNGKKIDLVIDLSRLDKNHRISRKARGVYIDLLNNPNAGRIALVGLNTFLRIMLGFLLKASKAENRTGFFETEDEAFLWMKKN